LREIFRGRLWTARPATVAAVRDDLVAVYLAPGTIFKVPANTSPDGNVVIDPDLSWRWKDEEELDRNDGADSSGHRKELGELL